MSASSDNPLPPGNGTAPLGEETVSPNLNLDQRDMTTALVHLYRAEITRANSWRSRLDVTTNWALIATSAAITFAFGNAETHHSVILLQMMMVSVIWFIEARRYRYYEVWSYRTRLIETDFYAPMLSPRFPALSNWQDHLAESLARPRFVISLWEAAGRRLRRNYLWIYLVLDVAWVAKLLLYLQTAPSFEGILTRARLGFVSGGLVMLAVILFNIALVSIAVLTRRLHKAAGEIE
jgi:uncharacterized membrane protein